jgi:hypothetical protein
MAVSKVTRSKSPKQINAQSQAQRSGPNHQRKAEFFETLQHLNRGYGIALSALERLETKDRQLRPLIFPAGCLRDYRNRTEALRAVANRDLLRLVVKNEDLDATRFSKSPNSRNAK